METEVRDEELLFDADGNVIAPAAQQQEASAGGTTDGVGEGTVNKGTGGEDETLVAGNRVDEDDEVAQEGETAEEAEARRERNRQRRKDNKTKRREYIENLHRELAARDSVINEMNQRLATVERKASGSEMAQLDNAEREAQEFYSRFKEIHAKAVEQADGKTASEATEQMLSARQRIDQIASIKKAMQQRQAAPTALDPRMVNHAKTWMSSHPWYDPSGKDEDSSLVLSIDNRLAQEGWNPTTQEYWDELETRVKKYLPHRVKQGYNQNNVSTRTQSRAPVAGSGRESTGNRAVGYRLSAERVQALKDAGMWDDPKQRAEAIKRYQAYDKQQGVN